MKTTCPACRAALLSTDELAQVTKDSVDAMLEGDGREIDSAEQHRHTMLAERWRLARMKRSLELREQQRRSKAEVRSAKRRRAQQAARKRAQAKARARS